MKLFGRLSVFTVFVWVTLLSVRVFAQSKVYINEGFVPDAAQQGIAYDDCWDFDGHNVSGNMLVINDGASYWGGWVYDPSGTYLGEAMTERIVGLNKMQTKPFTVTEAGEMRLTMDVWYFGRGIDTVRQFGVRMRENLDNAGWDTIWLLRTKNWPVTGTNGASISVDTLIGDKYNGKEMIFQLFLYNSSSSTTSFMILADNIVLQSYAAQAEIRTEVTSAPYFYGEEFTVKLSCLNSSMVGVSSAEFAYGIEGAGNGAAELTFSPAIQAYGGVGEAFLPVSMAGCEIGKTYKLAVWPVKINGEASLYADTAVFEFNYLDESLMTQQFIPLMESFTASTCPPCKAMNTYLNPVLQTLKEEGKINVIKYQMNFPGAGDKYYIAVPNMNRFNYYGLNSVPSPVYNGESNMLYWPATNYPGLMDMLEQKVNAAVENKALMSIEITKATVYRNSKYMELEFTVTSALDVRANVHAMVVEGTTTGNKGSNGETEFHWVTMKAATGGSGSSYNFKQGEPKTYTYTVNLNGTNVEELDDLQVVCFAQDNASGYIFQSAGTDVRVEDVANEKKVLAGVDIYPNPASEKAVVNGLDNARVEVLDMNGRMMYSAGKVSGTHALPVRSLNAGTYMVRISQNGATATRKLVVM